MKRLWIFVTISSLFMFISCASTKVSEPPAEVKDNQPEIQKTEEIVIVQEPTPEELEYERSTSNVSVSFEVFNDDKNNILHIIDELNVIMNDMNFGAWQTYLDQESIMYWSKKSNLQVASSRLPVKNIRLNNLKDYFIHVFLPSHKGHRIDEIRYETESLIKAVQVSDDTDIVYYKFDKIDDTWKLHLPVLSD